jgi:hypothetical protein
MLPTCFASACPSKPPASCFGLESDKGFRRLIRTPGDFFELT